MKTTFRRTAAAISAAVFLLGTPAMLPQFSAVCAVDLAAETAGKPQMTFQEKLPDLDELRPLGTLSLAENHTSTGFRSKDGEADPILNGATQFYLQFEANSAVAEAEVELEIRWLDENNTEQTFSTNVTALPVNGDTVLKIDTNGKKVTGIGLYGRNAVSVEAGAEEYCEVTLYRAKSNLPEEEVKPPVFTQVDALPAESCLTLLKKMDYKLDGKLGRASFPVTPVPEDEFTCYYLYIPQQKNTASLKFDFSLMRTDNNGNEVSWGTETCDLKPESGATVIKIDTYGKQNRRFEYKLHNVTAAEGHDTSETFQLFLYASNEQQQMTQLKAIEAPAEYTPIVEMNRIENPAEKTTLSGGSYTTFSHQLFEKQSFEILPYVNPHVVVQAPHEIGSILVEYNADDIDWNSDDYSVEGGIQFDYTTYAPYVSDLYSIFVSGTLWSGIMQQGRYKVFEENNMLNYSFMEYEAKFDKVNAEDSSPKREPLPAENGKVNLLNGDTMLQDYQNYSVYLAHTTDEPDSSLYANLTFRAMSKQENGEWTEQSRFLATAQLESKGENAKYSWVKLPNKLLNLDDDILYVIEPQFYQLSSDGDTTTELTSGIGYAALCGSNAVPKPLASAELPENSQNLSEVYRLENTDHTETISFRNTKFGYLEPAYEADYANYPTQKLPQSELWYTFNARTELIACYRNSTNEGVISTAISDDRDGYVLPLIDGKYGKLLELESRATPWNADCMQVVTEFQATEYTKDEPENGQKVAMPEGRGTLNISGAGSFDQSFEQYYVKLRHSTNNAYDNANYAELTFHIYTNASGEWKEGGSFVASAQLDLPAGGPDYTSDGCAVIPNALFKATTGYEGFPPQVRPEISYLYVISPRFYSLEDDGTKTEITEGVGYAALCGYSKAQTQLMGDINCDKLIDVSDAVMLARFCAEDATVRISNEGKQHMDVNGDGTSDTNDVTAILRIIAKLPIAMVN